MPKLSLEATIGLLFEVLLAILDHLHIREPLIIWSLFIVGLILIADSIVRGEWAEHIENPKRRRKRRVLWGTVAAIVFGVFGYWVYARLHQSETEGKEGATTVSPTPVGTVASNTHINISRLAAFEEYSFVAPNKQLAFRFYFRTNDDRNAQDVHIVSACSITERASDFLEKDMIDHFISTVRSDLPKQNPANGVFLGAGSEAYRDVTCSHLSQSDVNGLINGKGRLYVFLWVGWIGEDGVKGEQSYGLWMTHLKRHLGKANITDWNQLQLPTQRLW